MDEEMAKYLDDNLSLLPLSEKQKRERFEWVERQYQELLRLRNVDVPMPGPNSDDVIRDANIGGTTRFRRYEQLPVGTDWNYKWWMDEDGCGDGLA